jgi:hypothetical protein
MPSKDDPAITRRLTADVELLQAHVEGMRKEVNELTVDVATLTKLTTRLAERVTVIVAQLRGVGT